MPISMANLPMSCDKTCSWDQKADLDPEALAGAQGEVRLRRRAGAARSTALALFVMMLS